MSQATLTLILLGVMALAFLSQRIPYYITALAGALALGFLGILPMGSLFAGMANPTLILFAGMFVIGESLFQTGLASGLGEWAVKRMGGGERRLLWVTMIVAGALSTVASNTGTTAALMPVVIGICLSARIPVSRQLMPMAFTTGYGGFSALIGTPPNMIVTEALRQSGNRAFGFFEFAWVGIPLALAGMLYMDLIGRRLLRSHSPSADSAVPSPATATTVPSAIDASPSPATAPPSSQASRKVWRMWLSGIILLAVVAVMALNLKSLPLEIVAVIGAMLCVVTGCIGRKEAIDSIEWETMILFGSMFAVALAMEKSGASALLADGLFKLVGTGANPYAVVGLLIALPMLLGTFLSNTACAVLLTPIALTLAENIHANPEALLMAVAVGASCSFLTPVGTPPNLIVLEPGGYRFLDYVKVGSGLSVVCLLVGMAIIPWKWPVFHVLP